MSNCPTCNKSIISQTETTIGKTQCTQPCPPEITCEDIIPSNCVFYSGSQLICPSGTTSVNYGDTITEALNKMYQLLCQNTTSCTAKITANDECCGYLFDKFSSSSLAITTVTNPLTGCQTLNIEEGCFSWNNVLNAGLVDGIFLNSWTNFDPTFLDVQRVQYSNVKGCSVKLRGSFARNQGWNGLSSVIFILPPAFRPLKTRWFHATVDAASFGLKPATILIKSTGEVEISTDPLSSPAKVTSSFDGIEFEIN